MLEDQPNALKFTEKAFECADELKLVEQKYAIYHILGRIYCRNDIEKGLNTLQKARAIAHKFGMKYEEARILTDLGRATLSIDENSAKRIFSEATAIFSKLNLKFRIREIKRIIYGTA